MYTHSQKIEKPNNLIKIFAIKKTNEHKRHKQDSQTRLRLRMTDRDPINFDQF